MKRTYHICISAGNEIYCRDEQDYIRCFNSLAMAIAETESSLLAESIMSTHMHTCVRTECPKELVEAHRRKYSRYYNTKYKRRGRLGERQHFIITLEGLYHNLAAMSYTLRNSLHHGIAPTPFAYPHCSARVIFRKELGFDIRSDLMPKHNIRSHLPGRCKCPEGWRMDRSGLLLREDVIDTSDVEHMYGTPRNFLFHMNRLSGEEWKREQEKDKEKTRPVTIETIETGISQQTIEQILHNEHGRNDYRKMSDIELCHLIDKVILPELGTDSVYKLSHQKKSAIAEYLFREHRLTQVQIRRCLAIP